MGFGRVVSTEPTSETGRADLWWVELVEPLDYNGESWRTLIVGHNARKLWLDERARLVWVDMTSGGLVGFPVERVRVLFAR